MTDPMPSNSTAAQLQGISAADSGSRRRKRLIAAIAILSLACGALWYTGFRPADATKAAGAGGRLDSSLRPIPVVVAPVRQGSLDVYLFGLGTVTPLNAVMVRGRVDGQLMRVAFEEGQMVQAGDLLAQIDPRPFEVQLTLATGQLARNQALLDNARTDLQRYRMLLEQDSISRQQVDTQESLVRQYEAALLADQGGIDNAKLQLTHARVVAPISGRVGLRQVDPGNIVRASDANGIVVITQLQPIAIVFPIPEDALPRVMKRLRGDKHIPVDAFDRAQKEKLGSGRLLAADNQIDIATGTIRLKAEFPNADGALFANQFVNVRMPVETLPKATLVPTAAIQRGAAGTFVYVVKNDQTVAVTPVKVGPVQGEITAIDSGIPVGAMVVVDGADRLREGAKVEFVVRDKPTPPANASAQPHSDIKDKDRLLAKRNPRSRSGA
jgi:multidrug efflux system membrane fusion protein